MDTQDILSRSVQTVAFLFAAFSGFLKGIAPPEEREARFAVGTASLLSLCIFLLVSNWIRKRRSTLLERRLWFALAGALTLSAAGTAFAYHYNTNRLTFGYPPDNPHGHYIAGTEYLPAAAALAAQGQLSPPEVVAKFGGLPNTFLVWRPESIERAQLILISNYLLFVLSLAGAIFSLIEMRRVARLRRG
jgi:hypothetical protein